MYLLTSKWYLFIKLIYNCFQCFHHPNVDENKLMLHLISHYTNKMEDQMHAHLVNWIVRHRKWIKQISADILNRKKQDLSDYLNDLVMPYFKLDEIALLIYTRMYHIDLGVVLHKSYWCPAIHDDIFEAKVILAFKGKLTFENTKPIQGAFQVSEDKPRQEQTEQRGRSTKNSQQAGWFTNQEWHDPFDPHKPPLPPPMPPSPLPPIHTPNPKPGPSSRPKQKWNKKKGKKSSGLSVKTYGIKRHKIRPKDFKCPATKKCNIISKSQRKLNQHLKQAHPNFRFMCSYCPKWFETYNANYKHEWKHGGESKKCAIKECKAVFMYKKDMENHIKMHTGVGLIPCLHYNNKFTTNISMCAHAKIHLNEVHTCKTCGKSSSTVAYLKQHSKGKHGSRFIALCGEIFQWPKKMHYHEAHCQNCFQLDQENQNKATEIKQHIKLEKKKKIKELKAAARKVARKSKKSKN